MGPSETSPGSLRITTTATVLYVTTLALTTSIQLQPRRHAVTPSLRHHAASLSQSSPNSLCLVSRNQTRSTAHYSPPVAVHTLILCLCPRHTAVLLPASVILFIAISAVIFPVLPLLRSFATPSPPARLNTSVLGLLRILRILRILGLLGFVRFVARFICHRPRVRQDFVDDLDDTVRANVDRPALDGDSIVQDRLSRMALGFEGLMRVSAEPQHDGVNGEATHESRGIAAGVGARARAHRDGVRGVVNVGDARHVYRHARW